MLGNGASISVAGGKNKALRVKKIRMAKEAKAKPPAKGGGGRGGR